jgi:hypothetical protein
MRSLLVMGIPYQHAPEVSIVRTDTCLLAVRSGAGWSPGFLRKLLTGAGWAATVQRAGGTGVRAANASARR